MKLCKSLWLSIPISIVFSVLSYGDQLDDAKTAIQNESFEKAFELLQPLVEENNAEAQFLLGTMYINGQGVAIDSSNGLSLILKAAKQGCEDARTTALSLNADQARQGDTGAMYNVGLMCLNGWGGEQNPNDCLKWLETAANYGHINSTKVLSSIYAEGKYDIAQDKEKASYWSSLPETFANGINGRWEGTTPPEPGVLAETLRFVFEAKGNNLKGTVSNIQDSKVREIKNGKIEGNMVSFAFKSSAPEMSGGEMTYTYTGVLSGNILVFSYTSELGDSRGRHNGTGRDRSGKPHPLSFVAKRVL